jgi:hypothetical protein
MRTCVKCGERIKEKDAIYFDSPTSHPSRYICPCCAEEEGIEKESEVTNDRSNG